MSFFNRKPKNVAKGVIEKIGEAKENKTFTCPFCFAEYDKTKLKYFCVECGNEYIGDWTDKIKGEAVCRNEDCEAHKLKAKTIKAVVCANKKCGEFSEEERETETKDRAGNVSKNVYKIGTYSKYVDDDGYTEALDKQEWTEKLREHDLPLTARDAARKVPLCIIGITASGKTNFITTATEELKHVDGKDFTFIEADKETRRKHKEDKGIVYGNHSFIEATAKNAFDENLRPQLWELKKSNSKSYCITVYDGAGEDHYENIDVTSNICGYIKASKAIILTLDPLLLNSMKNIDEDIKEASGANANEGYETDDTVHIVKRLAEYIRQIQGIKNTKKIDIPIAIVMTKFDVILQSESLPDNALLQKSSVPYSDGKVITGELEQIHTELKDWLCKMGEGSFITALDLEFKNYKFFGVSSVGAKGVIDFKNDDYEIRPHRVLDPILWILKEEHVLD